MKSKPPENNPQNNLSGPATPLRFALYRRVSTADQEDKDISLPAQRRQQLDFVTKAGGALAFEFEDGGISGRTAGRAGFQEAVAAAKARLYDVLLIHKSDRVFRNRDDAYVYKGLLKKYGVSLMSVTESWVGKDSPGEQLMEGVMECINEFYSANLSLEVKKGMREIAEGKGRQSGMAPYGYTYINIEVQGSGWQEDPEAAAWVRWMFDQFTGGQTLADIARQLNRLGAPPYFATPRGKGTKPRPGPYWYSGRVGSILRSRVYLGEVQHSGEWFAGVHPPLIAGSAFETAQKLIVRRGKGRTEQSEHAIFAGGLLRCPLCLGVMFFERSGVRRDADGNAVHVCRYRCKLGILSSQRRAAGADPAALSCEGFEISQEKALKLILATLSASRHAHAPGVKPVKIMKPAKITTAATINRTAATINRDAETRRAGLLAEMSRLARMRQGYLDLAAAGDMRVEEMRESLAALAVRQKALEAALLEMEEPQAPQMLSPADAAALTAALEDPKRTARQKRDVLRLSVDHFMVWQGKDGVDIAASA